MSSLFSRRDVIRLLINIFRFVSANRAIPVKMLFALRKLAGKQKDALGTAVGKKGPYRFGLRNEFLANALMDEEFGGWAFDAQVLNFLETQIQQHRPGALLEFGSGLSTICFARFMYELHGQKDQFRVLSIEQNIDIAQSISEKLNDLGLERVVKLIHAPLESQMIEGRPSVCYQLPGDLNSILSRQPSLIIVDGPAGEDGVRFGTIPLVRKIVKEGSIFFLDDALRDGELEIAARWMNLSYLTIFGIHLMSKGLLAGRVDRN